LPLIRLLPALIVLLAFPVGAEPIQLDIFPSVGQIRPVVDSARFVVSVKTADLEHTRAVRLRILLTAPEPGWLFSTDFPRVEGRRLLDMETTSGNGRAEWEYVFPIRGTYRLEVEAVLASGDRMQETFHIPVKEQEQKYLYLGIVIGALFLFGFVAGRILTASSKKI
jgi:hypothetical protein